MPTDSSSCHFDTLIDRGFWIPKITIGNLCKLFHDLISPYLPTPKQNVEQEKGKLQKFRYLKKLNSI